MDYGSPVRPLEKGEESSIVMIQWSLLLRELRLEYNECQRGLFARLTGLMWEVLAEEASCLSKLVEGFTNEHSG
jgi:hypothetical protein